MKVFKRILKTIFILAIMGIVYSFFFSVYENTKINKMVKDFKGRGIYSSEIELKASGVTYIRRYYEVPRETSHELNDKSNVFHDDNKMNLGQTGDIFVTLKSPFKDIPVIHQFVSYYYGGHAALIYYELDQMRSIEAFGFPEDDESILDYIFSDGKPGHGLSSHLSINRSNNWQRPSANLYDYYGMFYRDEYIGLRPINPFIDEEDADLLYEQYKQTAIDRGLEKTDNKALYNFLFFLNMKNKYYCSDLMSRVYEEAYETVKNGKEEYRTTGYAKRMNDDGFITSIQDLILSKDTFMTFYVEITEEEVDGQLTLIESIYYLADV